MGSYAYITIAGFVIDSTKDYFSRWYFKKSERRIFECKRSELNAMFWGEPDAAEADEIEEQFVFEAEAATLKRRLELAGYTRATLQQEFKSVIADRIAYDGGENPEHFDDHEVHMRALHAPLDEWLRKLQEVVQKKLKSNHWESMPSTGDPMLDILLRTSTYSRIRDDLMAESVFFPCSTLESFAVAVLEVVPEDSPCVLDVTSLVQGGWTDEFDDLAEYSQDFTDFYEVFEVGLAEIDSLRSALPANPILIRLLYANAITAMETYLADTVKKNVLNRPALLRRFVEFHRGFVEMKKPVSQVFEIADQIKAMTNTALDEISFHNIHAAMVVYERVFAMEFPKADLPELFRSVQRRHDIVHRNGKDTSGKMIETSPEDLDEVIRLVTRTIRAIDKQVKDGLIDEEDDAN